MRQQKKFTSPNPKVIRSYSKTPSIRGANLYSAMKRREVISAKEGKILPSRAPRIRSTARPGDIAREREARKQVLLERNRLRAPEKPGPFERFMNFLANIGKRKPRE